MRQIYDCMHPYAPHLQFDIQFNSKHCLPCSVIHRKEDKPRGSSLYIAEKLEHFLSQVPNFQEIF